MPNLFESLTLLADRPLTEQPWSDMDSLLCASLCYNRFGPLLGEGGSMPLHQLAQEADLSPWAHLPYAAERSELLKRMAASRRWGNARACCYVDVVDHELPMQFSAITLLQPEGPTVICFRGTDNTLTGWRQDLYMSFESPVPGQQAAAFYLKSVADQIDGPILLTGHSKGGNLAFYAMTTAGDSLRQRIIGAWNFDGPGLDEKLVDTEAYREVEPRLHSIIPQGSIIGVMMRQQDRCSLVTSTARGLRQHDVFSWVTQGEQLLPADRSSVSSRLTDRTVSTFLKECQPSQRRIFVDALFDLLQATQASTVTELKNMDKEQFGKLVQATGRMDNRTKLVFVKVAAALLQSSAVSAADMLGQSTVVSQLKEKTQQNALPLLKQLTVGVGGILNAGMQAIRKDQQPAEENNGQEEKPDGQE